MNSLSTIMCNLFLSLFAIILLSSSLPARAQGPNAFDYCILQFPATLSATSGGTTELIYGRVFEAGLTEAPGSSPVIAAQVGYGPVGTDPQSAPGWTYFTAVYNVQVGNDDEYLAAMVAPAAGAYRYVFRFSLDGGMTWSYADLDGAGTDPGLTFDPNNIGTMNVSSACPTALAPDSQYFSSGAATGMIGISAAAGCSWAAISNAPWLTVTSNPPSGSGDGLLNYSVSANTDSTQRTGTIAIGNKSFTVVQASANCTMVAPTGGNLTTGTTGSFGIGVSDMTGQGVVSFSITLAYDPAVVAFNSVDNAGTLSAGFTVGGNVISPGILRIAGFGTSPLSGGGSLISVRFSAIGPVGSTSPLNYTSIQFNEGGCAQTVGTGSITIVGRSVSGSVLYGTAPMPFGVEGVRINAFGNPSGFALTDANGAYSVTGLGTGALTLQPSLLTPLPVNGITALDASLVLQAVLEIVTLNANQAIAADASANGSITPFDAALIARYAVGLPNTVYAGTWRFSPTQRTYGSLPDDLTGQDFALILMGEVTGNWTPSASLFESSFNAFEKTASVSNPRPNPGSIKLSLPSLTVPPGLAVIPLTLANYNGQIITSYQFELRYNPSVLVPDAAPIDLTTSLSAGYAFEFNAAEPGLLRVAAYGVNPIAGNGTLANLRFNVIGAGRSRSDLVLEKGLLNEGTPAITVQNGKITVKR